MHTSILSSKWNLYPKIPFWCRKIHSEIPPCGICDFGHFYEVRESSLPHGGISKIFFPDHFSPSFLGQKMYFWVHIPF
jgi:hypothetical protein